MNSLPCNNGTGVLNLDFYSLAPRSSSSDEIDSLAPSNYLDWARFTAHRSRTTTIVVVQDEPRSTQRLQQQLQASPFQNLTSLSCLGILAVPLQAKNAR